MSKSTNNSTAYTDREVLRKRALQAVNRGDKYTGISENFLVGFDPNFDRFAAAVAHADEIRRRVIYRSDGGKFARGLVRGSGDLKTIHDGYLSESTPAGIKIRLRATFWRRKDLKAQNRWVMSIRFKAPDVINVNEGETHVADEQYFKRGQQRILDDFIDRATFIAEDIPGERGKRIRKFVKLLDDLNFPHNQNLWYYGDQYVRVYLDWRTDDRTRRLMTRKTGGKLPFDGRANTGGISGEWRCYPFRDAVMHYNENWSDAQVKGKLVGIDNAIYLSYAAAQKVGASSSLGGGSLHGDLANAFLKHMSKLQQNNNHLYSAYK